MFASRSIELSLGPKAFGEVRHESEHVRVESSPVSSSSKSTCEQEALQINVNSC